MDDGTIRKIVDIILPIKLHILKIVIWLIFQINVIYFWQPNFYFYFEPVLSSNSSPVSRNTARYVAVKFRYYKSSVQTTLPPPRIFSLRPAPPELPANSRLIKIDLLYYSLTIISNFMQRGCVKHSGISHVSPSASTMEQFLPHENPKGHSFTWVKLSSWTLHHHRGTVALNCATCARGHM